jgi:hypothetical protein
MATLLRKLLCYFGWCQRCRTNEDYWAIWGECIDCGKRYGKTSRGELRAYIEAEALAKLRGAKGRKAGR